MLNRYDSYPTARHHLWFDFVGAILGLILQFSSVMLAVFDVDRHLRSIIRVQTVSFIITSFLSLKNVLTRLDLRSAAHVQQIIWEGERLNQDRILYGLIEIIDNGIARYVSEFVTLYNYWIIPPLVISACGLVVIYLLKRVYYRWRKARPVALENIQIDI